jgi:hypothetical protein
VGFPAYHVTPHLLCGADAAAAHAAAQAVSACLDQAACLCARDNVATDDVQCGVLGLDVLEHLQVQWQT